ncbi:hypothetical protein BVG79_01651 [Ketogulonicigenium robustum]|uniref:Glycosyltransferase 61 catalytic domain-containing protein n=1 Tax=Ketogulonicigenium robustum TaxID=92947 RepID=A0A1W6P0G0_9RHOB|nr:hypothetical protein BVG79_01651 [Ketogulonicigenium robustum]
MTGDRHIHGEPALPDEGSYEEGYLPGTHAFGGVFFGHFGHFIAESTGRLWALGEPDLMLDGVVYAPKEKGFSEHAVQRQAGLLAAIGVHTSLTVVDRPTRVERLLIPAQEFGLSPALIRGTPRYVDFMRKCAATVQPEGAELVYISRQGLPVDRGMLLGEQLLVDLLVKEGYRIFQPQRHTLAEQAAQYRAAKKIISVDASPLHFLAYVACPDQKISIIKRRSMDAISNILAHLESFASPDIQVIDHIRADYVNKKYRRIGRTSWSEVGLRAVGEDLLASGMIGSLDGWRDLTAEEIEAQLAIMAIEGESPYTRLPVATHED